MVIKLFGDKLVIHGSIEDITSRIFKCSIVGANTLRRIAEKPMQRPVWLSVVFEYMFFYLTLTRQHTWDHLPVENQEKLANEASHMLLTAVVDYVFEDDGTTENTVRVEQFKAELAGRIEEYSKFACLIRESESEPAEGTALWAFCNKVAALVGSPKDISCTMTTHSHIYDSLVAIGMRTSDPAY